MAGEVAEIAALRTNLHTITRGVARISGRGVLKNFSAAALAAYARART